MSLCLRAPPALRLYQSPFHLIVAVASVVACAVPSSLGHEDPRGEVFPRVRAEGRQFRIAYLVNDAHVTGNGGRPSTFQMERSVGYERVYAANGTLLGQPVKLAQHATTYETDALYGRAIAVMDLGSGYVRTDGVDWFFLRSGPVGPDTVLLQCPWFATYDIRLPWGSLSLPRAEKGTTQPLQLPWPQMDDRSRQRVTQLHIDTTRAVTVLERVLLKGNATEYPEPTSGLRCFRRPGSAHAAAALELSVSLPSFPALPRPPCIREHEGQYYVAYIRPSPMPSRPGTHSQTDLVDVDLLCWSPMDQSLRGCSLVCRIDWNTHVSFALLGNVLLLAYHQGSPTGKPRSEIIARPFDLDSLPWVPCADIGVSIDYPPNGQ